MVRLLLASLLALAGCYHPTLADCRVACGPGGACPEGLSCQDSMCVTPRPELQTCAASPLRQLAVGGAHACLVLFDHTLACWGANDAGQLGDGTTSDRGQPIIVGTFEDWISVSAGARHTCGLRSDGSAWCWGDDSAGQLGTGGVDGGQSVDGGAAGPAPVAVAAGPDWVTLAAGDNRTCGTRSDGSLWCWGRGQATPARVGVDVGHALVDVGDAQICTLEHDRSVHCRADDGSVTTVGAGGWAALAVGAAHACAIDVAGALSCWGANESGQLGDGSEVAHATPARVGSGRFKQVSAGQAQSCAVDLAGALFCWGANSDGQLGDGSTVARAAPAAVGGSSDWLIVRSGGDVSCGVHALGAVQCWGADDRGQVGDGGPASARLSPSEVQF